MKRLLTILLGVALCATSVNAQLIGRPGSLVAAASSSAPQQNLILYSEQMHNAAWQIYNGWSQQTENEGTDGDGESTLEEFGTGWGEGWLYQGVSLSTSTQYTISVEAYWYAGDDCDNIEFQIYDGADVVQGSSNFSTSMTETVQRFSYTFTTAASLTGNVNISFHLTASCDDAWLYLGRVHLYEGDEGDKSYITTTSTAYDP